MFYNDSNVFFTTYFNPNQGWGKGGGVSLVTQKW